MKGMMKKPVVMGYMKNYVNMGLYYWMHKVKATMGEYALTMAKSNPKKAPVFLVRFKDGSYASHSVYRLKGRYWTKERS